MPRDLAKRRKAAGYVAIAAIGLDATIEAERAKLRSPSWSNAELASKLRRQSHVEADRFAAGIV